MKKEIKRILKIGLYINLILFLLAFIFSKYANAESFKAKY